MIYNNVMINVSNDNTDMCDIYKLHDWIDIDKINWDYLSFNKHAVYLLKTNIERVYWKYLSMNINAVDILEKNIDKIYWDTLTLNPNAIHLLEKNIDKIYWYNLSRNPNAIHLLEKNLDKINWFNLSRNPNIFTYDYNKMKLNGINVREELIAKVLHPTRLVNICEKYNIEFDIP